MRLPRMTTRRWMIFVAMVAIGIGGEMTRRRWVYYRMKAVEYAREERLLLDVAEEQDADVAGFEREAEELMERAGLHEGYSGEDGRREEMARVAKQNALKLSRFAGHTRQVAAFYGRLKRKYECAVVLPLLSVDPDPPAPDEIPGDTSAGGPSGTRTFAPAGLPQMPSQE